MSTANLAGHISLEFATKIAIGATLITDLAVSKTSLVGISRKPTFHTV